jgi:hypothetical protein
MKIIISTDYAKEGILFLFFLCVRAVYKTAAAEEASIDRLTTF